MKRLAIYTFFDSEGILHQYHMQYLLGLKEIAEPVLLVANGKLTEESRLKLDTQGITCLVRENRGIDFSAWKAGLDHFGQNFVSGFDELILCNCSCYGPIFPFSNSFEKMASSSCDFWGIYRQPKHPDGLYAAHIQSFFYVFRHAVLESDHFWNWWKDLIPSNSYEEEILEHETVFTAYLEKSGFNSDTLMSAQKYNRLSPVGFATRDHNDIMVMEDKCPLIKRKFFFCMKSDIKKVVLYIKNNTNFDILDMCKDIKRNIAVSVKDMFKYYIKYLFSFNKKRKIYKNIFLNMYRFGNWKCKNSRLF